MLRSDRRSRFQPRLPAFCRAASSRSNRTLREIDDLVRNGQAGSGGWAGSIQYMQGTVLAYKVEVLHQFAGRRDGWRADSGAAWAEILHAEFRHKPLQR